MSVTDVNQRKFSGKSDGFWLTIRRQVLKGDRILLSKRGWRESGGGLISNVIMRQFVIR